MISSKIPNSKIFVRQLIRFKSDINTNQERVLTAKEDFMSLDVAGDTLRFPYIWLRDNCQCERCFHPTAKSRIVDWAEFNLNSKPVDVITDDNTVKLIWDDGHISRFLINWLKLRSFTAKGQKNYKDSIYKPNKEPWNGSDFTKILTKHDFNSVLTEDKHLYKWLYNLSVFGVALIENTPDSETALDNIVNRIGFTKKTHYGTKFIVQHVTNTSNVAYLSNKLQMHTDLPYYEYCPGVNLLHCMVQTSSEGGENLLSDCHYTAQYMRDNYPKEYKLLTEVEVEWSDVGIENGNEFFKLYRSPVICLNKHDEIIRINFSIPQRGSHFPVCLETVKPWYEAHSLFLKLNMEFAAKFKTKAGEVLVFDNIRLLHGRNGYVDKPTNVRKLIGAYIDWDEIYSRLRCLQVKFNFSDGSI